MNRRAFPIGHGFFAGLTESFYKTAKILLCLLPCKVNTAAVTLYENVL